MGYSGEYGTMNAELCYPSDHKILDQLELAIMRHKPKYVFVVSEIHDILERFKKQHTEVSDSEMMHKFFFYERIDNYKWFVS